MSIFFLESFAMSRLADISLVDQLNNILINLKEIFVVAV